MTYRLDSEIPWPYFTLFEIISKYQEKYQKPFALPNDNFSMSRSKNLMDLSNFITDPVRLKRISPSNKFSILAVISNCKSSKRLKIVQYLKNNLKHQDGSNAVDFHGYCSKKTKQLHLNDTEFSLLRRKYKFYLALENSNCQDYITEKFWMSIMEGTVPIVFGAKKSSYLKLVPEHSFIHFDEDFRISYQQKQKNQKKSIFDQKLEELKDYLEFLLDEKNSKFYDKYFEWRSEANFNKSLSSVLYGTQDSHDQQGLCKLCEMAVKKPKSVVNNLQKFWYGEPGNGTCWSNIAGN